MQLPLETQKALYYFFQHAPQDLKQHLKCKNGDVTLQYRMYHKYLLLLTL